MTVMYARLITVPTFYSWFVNEFLANCLMMAVIVWGCDKIYVRLALLLSANKRSVLIDRSERD
jgi:hypothetical protein